MNDDSRSTEFPTRFPKLPGAMPIWHGTVDAAQFRSLCEQVEHGGGKLVALWGSDELARDAGFCTACRTGHRHRHAVPDPAAGCGAPGLSRHQRSLSAANRMQRAASDLLGLHATGADDQRKWLRHGAWPADVHPLRKNFDGNTVFPTETDAYPFVTVTGDGVHEIPGRPGPCRHHRARALPLFHHRRPRAAPGTAPWLQAQRHRKTLREHDLEQGAKLAGRISGDSTVAYAWAYAQAVESVTGTTPSPRALALRAVLLELERIDNHLGDLGYLGNDVALAFGFAQFWILKEDCAARATANCSATAT